MTILMMAMKTEDAEEQTKKSAVKMANQAMARKQVKNWSEEN